MTDRYSREGESNGIGNCGRHLVFCGIAIFLTIIGAIVGVPMMIGGVIMMGVGAFGRRKTMFTHVVQV
jgi:hypothetical protein